MIDTILHWTAPLVVLLPFIFLIVVIVAMILDKPEKMVAQAGWKIQWSGMSTGRSRSYWVWVSIPGDPEHYVQVFNYALYNAGVGYTLARDYDGYKKDLP